LNQHCFFYRTWFFIFCCLDPLLQDAVLLLYYGGPCKVYCFLYDRVRYRHCTFPRHTFCNIHVLVQIKVDWCSHYYPVQQSVFLFNIIYGSLLRSRLGRSHATLPVPTRPHGDGELCVTSARAVAKETLGADYMRRAGPVSRAGSVCRDLGTSVKHTKNQLRDYMEKFQPG